MSNKRQIYDPNIDRDHSRPPAAIASVLDHMREGVASQRFRLALVGAQPSKAANGDSGPARRHGWRCRAATPRRYSTHWLRGVTPPCGRGTA